MERRECRPRGFHRREQRLHPRRAGQAYCRWQLDWTLRLSYDGKPPTALPADPAVLRKRLELGYRIRVRTAAAVRGCSEMPRVR